MHEIKPCPKCRAEMIHHPAYDEHQKGGSYTCHIHDYICSNSDCKYSFTSGLLYYHNGWSDMAAENEKLKESGIGAMVIPKDTHINMKNEIGYLKSQNAALRNFATLAKPMVEDWQDYNERFDDGTAINIVKQCTEALAAYPEAEKPVTAEDAFITKALKQPPSHCHNAPAKVYTASDLGGDGTLSDVCSVCDKPFLTAEEKAKEE